MDEEAKRDRLERFEALCRERGQPVTVQRRAILEAVLDLDNHPSADQVHEEIIRRFPQISRTTVYRTLETLVEMDIVTRACHPGSVVRYDGRTEVHHHLICLRCDAVIDFNDARLDRLTLPDTSAFGFQIIDHRVQLRGICQRCRGKEAE